MELDDFKELWLAQDRKIDEILKINQRLQLRANLVGPRAWLRWFNFAAMFEILLGILCLSRTGSFIYAHFGEPRFLVPAVALHLWLIGTTVAAVARFAFSVRIDYSAPVLEIQRRIEALRVFSLRFLRLLFVTGCVVWGVPFAIVVCRAWLGVDLYAVIGTPLLAWSLFGSAAFGFAVIMACGIWARWVSGPGSPAWLRRTAGAFDPYSLKRASDQLRIVAQFEREQ